MEVNKSEIDEEGNVIEEEIIGNETEEEEDENIFKDEDNNESSNNGGSTSNNNGSTGGSSTNNNSGNTSNNTTTTPTVNYGTIIINYVDEEGTKIAESTTDNKVKVGSTYKYDAPTMDGYINDNSSVTATISTKDEKKELTFKYANKDQVPYVST